MIPASLDRYRLPPGPVRKVQRRAILRSAVASPAAGPRCTFCGRVGHLHTWHDPAIRKFPCSRCGGRGHVAYNELVHPPARTLAQIRAAAVVAPAVAASLPRRAAARVADPARDRPPPEAQSRADRTFPPSASAAQSTLPPRPAPATAARPPARRSFLPARAPEPAPAAVGPLPEAAPSLALEGRPFVRRRARPECGRCGSTAHIATTPGAHPEEEGEAIESPAPPAPLARWTPGPDEGADDDQPLAARAIDRARAHATTTADGRYRSKTIPATARVRERRALALTVLNDDEFPDIPRPRTRGECAEVLRPCPFVSCQFSLYLDVDEETGALKLNHPHLEVWEMGESCALDVADRSGATLEEVGQLTAVSRERIRQIEERAIAKLRLRAPELAEPATRTAAAASQNGDAW